MKNLKIVSRKSPLARIQSQLVAEKINASHPHIKIQHIYKKTLGDADLNTPLDKMPDIGVFTNDIRHDLINKKADIAVHSWKDLPVDLEQGTEIVGTIERGDMRDMLFLKKSSINKRSLTILSSSPRREKNLSLFLPLALPFKTKIQFKSVRGNVNTRLSKLLEGDDDALVVAKAAIDRILNAQKKEFSPERNQLLEIQKDLKWMVLPLSQNPCAAAQGALAIEARQNDDEVKNIISSISDQKAFSSVETERSLLKSYGGGCHQKIGVSYEVMEKGSLLTVRGETEEGDDISRRLFNGNEAKDYFKSLNLNNYFPINKNEQKFFKRKELKDSEETLQSIKDKGIYVSRSNTILGEALVDDSNIIWTSGIKTWKSLAHKGYWVNGTSDSLGEKYSPEESPFKEIDWLKVTHAKNKNDNKEILVTYELEPLKVSSRIKDCHYFYWMSATSFQLALDEYPEIIDRKHACGLGKTYNLISQKASNVQPFLDFESWVDAITNKLK